MLQIKNKLKFTVLLFFFIIIILIFVTLLFLQLGLANSLNDKKQLAVYVFDKPALEQSYKNGIVSLDISKITSYAALEKEFYENMRNRVVIPFTIMLGCIVGIMTMGLYFVLKAENTKQLHKFINKICSVDKSIFLHSSNIFSESYHKLEKHFEENLKSFKRLSAYLSHEQKNAIAILRAKLEYNEYWEYLKPLDELSNSIDDILTLSASEDMEVLEETDCVLICAESCDLYRKLGHDIKFVFAEDDYRVLAKPRWIVRAVSNLLDNAVKYGNGKEIEVAIMRHYDSVVLTVTDYGCGIPEGERSKIFQNYYRMKDLKRDGYGIGLSLVSHVCELCGGFVWVESRLNKGSTFYLSFPAFELL